MLSNRESARRSRRRKQAHVQGLEQRSCAIEQENVQLREALQQSEARVTALQKEAELLRTKVHSLFLPPCVSILLSGSDQQYLMYSLVSIVEGCNAGRAAGGSYQAACHGRAGGCQGLLQLQHCRLVLACCSFRIQQCVCVVP